MATVLSELGFIFKDRSTYLSQANWQTFFGNALPSGFDKNIIYDSLGNFFIIGGVKVYIDGIQAATTENVQIDLPTEAENACLISFVYDNQDNKVELVRAVLSSGSLQERIARYLYYLATDMKQLSRSIAQAIYGSGAESRYTCLPVGVWAYGGDWWDLSRVITKNGETILYNYLFDSNDGDCPIYGGRKYNITVESTFSQSAVNLIPVPACSMESSSVYIKNDSGSQVTVKLPLLHNLVTYKYVHNGAWVVGADDISIPLADGGEMVINLSQSDQSDIYTLGGPISTYEVAQNSKAEDPGDVYTKAEANSIFATQADLADKADVSDVYTKTQADLLLADKADVDDVYSKTAADNLLADKADADDVYSKTAADEQFAAADDVYTKAEVDALISEVPVADNFYTKTETNELLAAKANSADVYTKAQTYSKTEADNLLDAKANASTTYTKTETDTLLAAKANADDVYIKGEVDHLLNEKADLDDVYTQYQADSVFAKKVSPEFSGTPKAPTAALGTNNTQIATTAFVRSAISSKANSYSPAFTGQPTSTTPNVQDNSQRIATTAFVKSAILAWESQETDLYVDQWNGSDSGTGSSEDPFATIQKAVDLVPIGSSATIHIYPVHTGDNVYYEAITISGKSIKFVGTTDNLIQIHTDAYSNAKAAINVLDGGHLELYGDFELEGEYTGLRIVNNSSVIYSIGSLTDKLSVRARGASTNVEHLGIEVENGSKFIARGSQYLGSSEVDIYVYPTNLSSAGVSAAYGSIVAADKIVIDMSDERTDQIGISNRFSIVMVQMLTGTYGTAYAEDYGFHRISGIA